jgi:V8-like Glu-specific endopeptidase
MKIGSVTGFSAGRVSCTQAFIYHENFGCEISLGHTVDMDISKGDSGAFLLNSKGEVVGIIVGAVKSSAVVKGEKTIFNQGCFINMEDALRWATNVLGEKVAIVPEPMLET